MSTKSCRHYNRDVHDFDLRRCNQRRLAIARGLQERARRQADRHAAERYGNGIGLPHRLGPIALIQRGGPFPHRQDGSTFGNREQQLPQRPRGYYREYTVDTPGARTRGTRRIVTGGDPPEAWYYTDDHYASFRSFTVPAQGAQQ